MTFSRGKGFSRFWFRGAIPLGLIGLLGLQGCSFVLATPAPPDPERHPNARCSGPGLAIADGVIAGSIAATAGLVYLSSSSYALGSTEQSRLTSEDTSFYLVDAAFAVLYLASSIYGADLAHECDAYQAGQDRLQRNQLREAANLQAGKTNKSSLDAANSDEPNERDSASPTGGAGFEFGESVEAVKARCGEHQGSWSSEPSGAACSWVRQQNLVRVELDFCEGGVVDSQPQALCHINMRTTPQTHDGRTWGKLFSSLRSQLRRRFGAPELRRLRYPDECQAPDNFYQCLVDGRVHGLQTWAWDDGHEVKLTLGIAPSAGAPSVNVSFSTAEYKPPPATAPINPSAATTLPSPPAPPAAGSSAPAAPPSTPSTGSALPPTAPPASAQPSSNPAPAPAPAPAPSGPVRKFPDSKAPN